MGPPQNGLKQGVAYGRGTHYHLFFSSFMAEGLVRMTARAVSNKLFTGMGPAEGCKVSIIQYADDTIFFCKANSLEVGHLKFHYNKVNI